MGGSPKWVTGGETELDTGVFGGVWHRTTLERLEGWDEGWAVNEDSELAARFRAEGMRIVGLPELAARYIPRDSLRGLARQYARYGFYRAKTARRHPASMRPSLWLPPGLVVTLAAAVAAPRPVRGLARAGIAVYAATLLAGSALRPGGRAGRSRGAATRVRDHARLLGRRLPRRGRPLRTAARGGPQTLPQIAARIRAAPTEGRFAAS